MSASLPVQRDERTIAVENASYRWSYLVLSFGLLITVMWRSYVYGESPFDLLFLVVLGGGVGAVYQAYHKVISSRQWLFATIVSVATAIITALLVVVTR